MLLERLRELSFELDLPPILCAQKAVSYVIQIDYDGNFLRMLDTRTLEHPHGELMIVPDYDSRTSGDDPIPVDHLEYTLGIPRPKKRPEVAQRRHTLFKQLVSTCAEATQESSVRAVCRFLEYFDPKEIIWPDDLKIEAKITFEVGDVRPMQLPAVQRWWATFKSTANASLSLECIVCGKICHPLTILPTQIHGLHGGQPSGVTLISGNVESAERHGLGRAHYAPICDECAHRCCTTLNMLLKRPENHMIIGNVTYIFWSSDNDLLSLITEARENEVQALLLSPLRGDLDLGSGHFYMAGLAPNDGRMMLLSEIDTTLGQIRRNMRRYFCLQHIVDRLGERRYFPLWQLANIGGYGSETLLMECALQGSSLPMSMLYSAIQKIYKPEISPVQMAVIKMVWQSQYQKNAMEEEKNPVALDEDWGNSSYLRGRLFRTLEAIEWQAQGEISAGCKAYFRLASIQPTEAFQELIPRAQYHLKKLKRDKPGAGRALEMRLSNLLERLKGSEPRFLSPVKTGIFLLGYYHQRTADFQAAKDAKEKKKEGQNDSTDLL